MLGQCGVQVQAGDICVLKLQLCVHECVHITVCWAPTQVI